MIGRILRRSLLAFALGAAACHGGSPTGTSKPWDAYAGEKLLVHGQDPATAGQKVWRALRDEPSLRGFLARQGEPDSLEVLGGTLSRFSDKTIVLYYTRRSMGPPHSIRLEPSKDGYTPRGSEPLSVAPPSEKEPGPAGRHRKSSSGSAMDAPPAAAADGEDSEAPPAPRAPVRRKAATAEQRVTCPVDPTRPDCQALCASDATQEWCH